MTTQYVFMMLSLDPGLCIIKTNLLKIMKKYSLLMLLALGAMVFAPNRVHAEDVLTSAKASAHEHEKPDIGNTTTFAWMHDLEKARAKAKAEKKPLFVMFRCEP